MEKVFYLPWKDEYSLGIDIVDEQHRGLIGIVNTFYYHVSLGNVDMVMVPTLELLRKYGAIHFATEEAMMKEMNYPQLAEQQEEHQALLEKTEQIAASISSENDVWKVMPFLKRFWMDHILTDDREFAECYLAFKASQRTSVANTP
ncbi:bacteriohemerythrin [Endozoicomonas ascidiicola]|uniref:bacteriohemerythrin n=1 Tax=Endozoicomonas ascidiicola TaxID=1698521 RepID=UPI00083586A8|nr:hemerythrin family protein [Endozoicomonas ascidiicola]